MVPCKSTDEEVSFEWSHHRISSTDTKVRTTLHISIIDCGSERVKSHFPPCLMCSSLNVTFPGRSCPHSSQNRSAHGTPRRMDGQPCCLVNGLPPHEKKEHYYVGQLTNSVAAILLNVLKQREPREYTAQRNSFE